VDRLAGLTQTAPMSRQQPHPAPDNAWRQPADPTQVVVETLTDIVAVFNRHPTIADLRLWSPPDAAGSHGVLWFVALQQACDEQFADRRCQIVLDCGDRADLAHAALREGLRAICFRGRPAMLSKLQAIAAGCGAMVETRHPALA
jgi:hypothetical protein